MSPPEKPNSHRNAEQWVMLTSGCPPPLKEDWCLRGMEWVGRKVYERGFWKSGEDQKAELEVLDTVEGEELSDGTIEDDDGDDAPHKSSSSSRSSDFIRRWVGITRCAVNLSGTIDGFKCVDGTRKWSIDGRLAKKVKCWKEEEQIERAEEERRCMGKRWVEDAMDVDEGQEADSLSEESEDEEDDSEEIKVLKVCLLLLFNISY
jgi:protein SMG6